MSELRDYAMPRIEGRRKKSETGEKGLGKLMMERQGVERKCRKDRNGDKETCKRANQPSG